MRGIIAAALCVALAGCGTQKAEQPSGDHRA